MVDDTLYKLWISSLYSIGPTTFQKIISNYSIKDFYNLSEYKLDYLSPSQIKEIKASKSVSYMTSIEKLLMENNSYVISFLDENYPEKLKNINLPPKSLFVKGKTLSLNSPCVSIIGSRNPTSYGLGVAYELSNRLSKYCTIISGMALGIDVQAHIGALESKNYTIGVIGTGIDMTYPIKNSATYEKMFSYGTIISEYSFGIPPKPWHFPARNRIISALSDVVIVVEAKIKSGTSITVNEALEQGKDVFAVPARINDLNSSGCLNLIKDGAYLLQSYKDVLCMLGIKENENTIPIREKIMNLLITPKSIIDLLNETDFTERELIKILIDLESKNLIHQHLPGFFMSNFANQKDS